MLDCQSGYTPLRNSVDDGGGKEDVRTPFLPTSAPFHPRIAWGGWKCAFVINTVVLLSSWAFFGIWLNIAATSKVTNVPESSGYSPAEVAVEYENLYFNGSYHYRQSEYRGPPEEVDALWRRFTNQNPLRLTEKDMSDAGIPLRPSLVKFHEEDGGGYMATLEVFHHLHCLDMLRKHTYASYYKPFDKMFKDSPESRRLHTDHCIELLRQRLMCTSDIELVTYDWIKDYSIPKPNFSTKHTCRNFDKIFGWYNQQAVQVPKASMTRIGDEEDLPEFN